MPNRNRQLLDIGAGIVTILLAILVYVDSASIKVIADTTLDARFYPKFLAVLMILLSLIIILRVGIQLSRAEHSSSGSAKENKHAAVKEMLPAVETLLLLGLYVFAIEPVGFLLSTPFYVFGQAWILAPKSQRNPVRFALLGVLSAVAIYCIFKFGFQLLVPPGILG
jgi:putative tricarboxylic transport membrane protein